MAVSPLVGVILGLVVTEGQGIRPLEPGPVHLTAEQRRARAELVRDAAADVGMTNGALLAGIGEVETNFAHCWSEATWACQGPDSSSCGGGPVIAGAADGPCSEQQGGLGMFQFDSGTYAQTLATYGDGVVTLEGNVGEVVPFLVTRAIQSIDGVNDEAQALAWMNSIQIQDGDPEFERWVYFVAWRYNGCMGCTTQINKYRNGTHKLWNEFGAEFWSVNDQPGPQPDAGPGPSPGADAGVGPGPDPEPGFDGDATGGCSVGGRPVAASSLWLLAAFAALIVSRRRRS